MSDDSKRKSSAASVHSNDSSSGSPTSRRSARSKRKKQLDEGPPTPESTSSWRAMRRRKASEMESSDEEMGDRGSTHARAPSRDSLFADICLCRPEPKIPRPSNSFILYRKHHQANILAQHPGLTNPDISKLIGEQWKNTSPEIKKEWKALAEEEKIRHQQQYPEYRYQPKRTSRSGPSVNSPSNNSFPGRCHRCSGRVILSPTVNPALNPFTPASSTAMNSLSLASPGTRRGSRQSHHHPPHLDVSMAGYHASPHESPQTPYSPATAGDQKRRRFTNAGGYIPTTTIAPRPSAGTPYPIFSLHRGGGDAFTRWPSASAHTMPPPPLPAHIHQQPFPLAAPDPTLTLPPLQTTTTTKLLVKPETPEETARLAALAKKDDLIKREPYILMIDALSRVAPPLRLPPPLDSRRGQVLCVEGDDAAAVAEVVDYLAACLGVEHGVRVAPGPRTPGTGEAASVFDYYRLVEEWCGRRREIVEFLCPGAAGEERRRSSVAGPSPMTVVPPATEVGVKNNNNNNNDADATPPPLPSLFADASATTQDPTTTTAKPPLLVLHRDKVHASRTWAARVPITDTYSHFDHWKWIASQWRGTVGADWTVYVNDVHVGAAGTVGNGGAAGGRRVFACAEDVRPVEIFGEYRTVVLRRVVRVLGMVDVGAGGGGEGGSGGGAVASAKARVEESALRRLGFEVGELLRGGR